ncbi:MAG: hypothetical protein NVSMB31_07860 [Vulcanimicrobiaceae bacterium]
MPISNNPASNMLTLTLNAAANCVQIDKQPSSHTYPPSVTFQPLENQNYAQTFTMVVTPCDVDGYAIPAGQQLANALVVSNVNPAPLSAVARQPQQTRSSLSVPPVTYSPAVITQGGPTTITVTEPAGGSTDTKWIKPSPFPTGGQYATVKTDPIFYVLVGNANANSISVLQADVNQTTYGTLSSTTIAATAPTTLVAGSPNQGCAQAGQAVAAQSGGSSFTVVTIPTPSAANPSPLPSGTTVAGFSSMSSTSVPLTMDNACNVYAGLPDGHLSSLTAGLTTFNHAIAGPYSNPTNGSPQFAYGNAPIVALGYLPSTTYVGLGTTLGYMNSMVDANNISLYPSFSAPGPVKAGTVDAIAPYDLTHEVVAYHDQSTGYLHFALYDGTATTKDVAYTSNLQVISIAGDSVRGNVYAVAAGFGQILQYSAGSITPSVVTQSIAKLPNTSPAPSAVAIAPTGLIYVADSIANNVAVYNAYYFGYSGISFSFPNAGPVSLAVFP